ncbi:hypothetical protein RI367_005315 [Sorochytrium milnesiophthora]
MADDTQQPTAIPPGGHAQLVAADDERATFKNRYLILQSYFHDLVKHRGALESWLVNMRKEEDALQEDVDALLDLFVEASHAQNGNTSSAAVPPA